MKIVKKYDERLEKICEVAMNNSGFTLQLPVMKEELLELAVELQKIDRGKHEWEKICEETFDAYVMVKQLIKYLEINKPELLEDWFKIKTSKLEIKFKVQGQ